MEGFWIRPSFKDRFLSRRAKPYSHDSQLFHRCGLGSFLPPTHSRVRNAVCTASHCVSVSGDGGRSTSPMRCASVSSRRRSSAGPQATESGLKGGRQYTRRWSRGATPTQQALCGLSVRHPRPWWRWRRNVASQRLGSCVGGGGGGALRGEGCGIGLGAPRGRLHPQRAREVVLQRSSVEQLLERRSQTPSSREIRTSWLATCDACLRRYVPCWEYDPRPAPLPRVRSVSAACCASLPTCVKTSLQNPCSATPVCSECALQKREAFYKLTGRNEVRRQRLFTIFSSNRRHTLRD